MNCLISVSSENFVGRGGLEGWDPSAIQQYGAHYQPTYVDTDLPYHPHLALKKRYKLTRDVGRKALGQSCLPLAA